MSDLRRPADPMLHEVIRHAPAAVWATRPDGQCYFLSDGWTALTGQSVADALEFGWLDRIHEDDRDRVRANWLAAHADRRAFVTEYRMKKPDGSACWMLDTARPRFDDAGEFHGFVGTVADDDLRHAAEAAADRLDDRYRRTLASIDQGFCVIELIRDAGGAPTDFRYLETNPRFEQLTGMPPMTGRRIREIVPDLETRWLDFYGRVTETGVPDVAIDFVAGLDRWFEVHASRIDEPLPDRLALLFNDVTARKRAEQALLDADRRKDEFIAMLAHELRNPLGPIRNAVQYMRLRGGGDRDLVAHRDLIDRQVTHLARLIDDLVDVGRITRDRLELRVTDAWLADVLRAAVDNTRADFDENGHLLEFDAPQEPVALRADPVRLAQMLINLLVNAVKYSPPASLVWLRVAVEGADLVATVTDVGRGIAPEQIDRLFEPFYQADIDLARSTGGLGLGLSIVKRLAELHGGSVGATSAGLGRGSEFTLRLPIVDPSAAGTAAVRFPPPSQALAEAVVAAEADAGRAWKVLVVDDNEDSAETLAEVLRIMGCEVETAYDGLAGVERARATRPDALVLDLGMPKLDGYAACRAIRAEPWGRGMVVIAVSGWGGDQDRARTAEAGFDAHLVKPVMPGDLLDTLEALLSRAPGTT